jgi:hypothetical protein
MLARGQPPRYQKNKGGGKKMNREQKLREVGWDILASANDNLFVVKNTCSDIQVLHFFYDSKYGEHMVEGYFTSSFDHKAQDELFEAPDKFLDKFYLYCSELMEDWCTKEDNLYK